MCRLKDIPDIVIFFQNCFSDFDRCPGESNLFTRTVTRRLKSDLFLDGVALPFADPFGWSLTNSRKIAVTFDPMIGFRFF